MKAYFSPIWGALAAYVIGFHLLPVTDPIDLLLWIGLLLAALQFFFKKSSCSAALDPAYSLLVAHIEAARHFAFGPCDPLCGPAHSRL